MGVHMEVTKINLGTYAKPNFAMDTPEEYFSRDIHAIALNTRETDYGSIVELKAYKPFQSHGHPVNGYGYPQQVITLASRKQEEPSTSVIQSPVKDEAKKITRPPKKKWIKEYLEKEPEPPVSVLVAGLPVRSNGVVRPPSPTPVIPMVGLPPVHTTINVALEPIPPVASITEYTEHSRPRTLSSNYLGSTQIPSPPSVSSNGSGSSSGSAPRAGTREVHNKLEKNRRAHLKECFELLKRQLPSTPDDKKTSNLAILGSAIRYIQVLRRKERECEHEMERLAREKIAAQQRLAALKREVTIRSPSVRPRIDAEENEEDERINGQIVGIPVNITTSPPRPNSNPKELATSRTLNLSTKLQTLPIQITPTTTQMVRTSYGARHNTLTLTTLAAADSSTQNVQPMENGVSNSLSTTLVHPAQIHLPLSQVVGSGGLVVGGAIQLLSTGGGVRVLQTPVQTNGISSIENNRISRENGFVSPPISRASTNGLVVSGLTPLVVSQPATHLLHSHTFTHKMLETQVVKASVAPLTVNAQYLSTTIVKPVVVVSNSHTTPSHGT